MSTYLVRYQPTPYLPTPCVINPCGRPHCASSVVVSTYLVRYQPIFSAAGLFNHHFQPKSAVLRSSTQSKSPPRGYRSCVYIPRASSTYVLFPHLWLSFTCLPTPCVINPYFCEGRLHRQMRCYQYQSHQFYSLKTLFLHIFCYF